MRRVAIPAAITPVIGLVLALGPAPPVVCGFWLAIALAPLGLSMGAMGLRFIHALTGGHWGEALQAAWTRLVPLWIVGAGALAPLLLSPESVLPWARGEPRLPGWFSPGALALRTLAAFAVLAALHYWSLRPSRRRATAGLILWLPTLSILVLDWIGGRDPTWYSSGFPATMAGFSLLAALAAAIGLAEGDGLPRSDLGNLLLAAVMFWIYLAFMEYLIIWSGDLPHEAGFYLRRSSDWGQWLAPVSTLLMGAIPFGLMLFLAAKRTDLGLTIASTSVLAGSAVYLLWLVAPGVP